MSQTEYYRGKLTPTHKTVKQINPKAEDVYDLGYERYVEIDGKVWEVKREEVPLDEDIFIATETGDEEGTINFEVKYYNGGCGFNEAIEMAIENMRGNK